MSEYGNNHNLFHSNSVVSNQTDVHENLLKTLERYKTSVFAKPLADHTVAVFAQAMDFIRSQNKPLILDSGCGTGRSSMLLAEMYKDHCVIAIDKSIFRLAKNTHAAQRMDNLFIAQADQFDFWYLAAQEKLVFEKHYILYPNPWPKKAHLKRRFYAHPHFFSALQISQAITVRSNWQILLQEFADAVNFYLDKPVFIQQIYPVQFWTLFEKKYHASGQPLFEASFTMN